jgi:hypothetical protein
MTQAVQEFLRLFDCLPEPERRDAFYEILKRANEIEYPPLDDETLAQIADENFQRIDAEEATERRR